MTVFITSKNPRSIKSSRYHNPLQYQNNLSKMAQSLYLKLEYKFIISESKTKPKTTS
ncbi:hypothetical protein WICANDRAFT_97592 [Wickerhamomyces anomalus NRRL Y-366-8]|uniref:Uncharacterized protein n=1 Tax=Wickerhamomyces anomalus (strain ATCC 58044 / CBS 1984 / NCYC 433 / NRRL Y-366-8) TaxID=683960 RepID=A0A1E3NVR1_WICAA|nr:uncharacterized protein WICANDRAFT_97592 [Wickerhamomyces anomalus NRRL Y-366-8]ODQ57080.1 hypothetical protein WICANDRAFT_97592 [Wickerhamomyces anomalus NRRL Y-366-8]